MNQNYAEVHIFTGTTASGLWIEAGKGQTRTGKCEPSELPLSWRGEFLRNKKSCFHLITLNSRHSFCTFSNFHWKCSEHFFPQLVVSRQSEKHGTTDEPIEADLYNINKTDVLVTLQEEPNKENMVDHCWRQNGFLPISFTTSLTLSSLEQPTSADSTASSL